jgi:hypothetical protein
MISNAPSSQWIGILAFDVQPEPDGRVFLNQVLTTLAHANNLQEFHYRHPISSSVLSYLSCFASASLRNLVIQVDSSDELSLEMINSLVNLENLALKFSESSPPDLSQVGSYSLDLPQLKNFEFEWPSELSENAAKYLSSC